VLVVGGVRVLVAMDRSVGVPMDVAVLDLVVVIVVVIAVPVFVRVLDAVGMGVRVQVLFRHRADFARRRAPSGLRA
jgi:hypothetical protein